ncbi:MAG: flagellar basal body protein FliL [Spirochaetaceae bacterium]|jgi:flagellar FliL protein|nr:flagellar basal body protein FliL [Spirochaetaceae bacterium]
MDKERVARFWTAVYRILLIITLALVLFIAGGTIYGLIFRRAKPLYTAPSAPVLPRQAPAGERIFTGIGRLRVITADNPPVTVVISVAFPYDPDDGPFTEELASKVPSFRRAVSEYFASHSAAELRETPDSVIKTALLKRYNNLLRLGTIETLYFNDLMFIE